MVSMRACMHNPLILLLFSLLLAACGSAAAEPTATTASPTVAPTLVAPATLVDTVVNFGPDVNVNHQFTIKELDTYVYRVASSRVEMVSLDGEVLFIIGILSGSEDDNAEVLIEALQDSLGAFELGLAGETLVGEDSALYQTFTSNKSGIAFEGGYALLPLDDGRQFFALGAGRNSQASAWQSGGQQAFVGVLGTVSLDIDPSLRLQCSVSPSAGYGLTPEQPIKVGGAALGELFGPNVSARVRAYFSTLRGPEGEMVGFERTGSQTNDDSIIDAYRVETLSGETTLYVDMYTYETLFAPQGFACAGDFPIGLP